MLLVPKSYELELELEKYVIAVITDLRTSTVVPGLGITPVADYLVQDTSSSSQIMTSKRYYPQQNAMRVAAAQSLSSVRDDGLVHPDTRNFQGD